MGIEPARAAAPKPLIVTCETVGQLDCSVFPDMGKEVRTVGTRTTGQASA
jgi:hypothetical protein